MKNKEKEKIKKNHENDIKLDSEETGCGSCHSCSGCDVDEVEKETSDDAKLKEFEEKYLRLQAEFINFRTRSANEVSDMLRYEGEDIIKRLLPITDNFERAIKMDNNDLSDEVSKFLEGFKMIYTSLMTIFKEIGVSEIDCLGKEFDPVYAQAVLVEQDNTKPAGVVLEVLTKGYKYKDKIIRPAMVKVNK